MRNIDLIYNLSKKIQERGEMARQEKCYLRFKNNLLLKKQPESIGNFITKENSHCSIRSFVSR